MHLNIDDNIFVMWTNMCLKVAKITHFYEAYVLLILDLDIDFPWNKIH